MLRARFPRRSRQIGRACLGLTLSWFAVAAPAAEPVRRPNVVIIFCDDLGYGDIGSFGAKDIATPNLDRMAGEGVKFTNFHVAQAVCTASRIALLTGCYPNRLGFQGALMPGAPIGIADEEETLAEMFRAQGYATGMAGKWHLGDAPRYRPTRHGFEEWLGIPYSNDMWPARAPRFPPLPLYDGDEVVNPALTADDQDELTSRLTERAVDFIKRNTQRPFFFYLAHPMPHVPLGVSERFRGKSGRGKYGDVVMEIDWSVGEILAALRETGADRDTLVLFLSDNGPWLRYGNHGGSAGPFREGKGTVFDGGTRVPCIARWPGGLRAGIVNDQVAMNIDLWPTLARLIGAPLPARSIDGRDIWPLFQDPAAANPHEGYFLYYADNELRGIRSGDWKLVLPHEYVDVQQAGMNGEHGSSGIGQVGLSLYNLRQDPAESTDLATKHPEELARLQGLAEKARLDLGDKLAGRVGTGRREPGRLAVP